MEHPKHIGHKLHPMSVTGHGVTCFCLDCGVLVTVRCPEADAVRASIAMQEAEPVPDVLKPFLEARQKLRGAKITPPWERLD